MDFSELISLLNQYGFGGTVVGVILIVLWLIVKSSWFSSIISKITEYLLDIIIKNKSNSQSKVKSITEGDILNHDIFNYIDFWMYSKVPTFQFSTEYRTVIFRRYLQIFLKKHKENLKIYVDKKDFEKMEDSELWTSLLSLINNIIYDYEREMEQSGIPKVVIEKMKVKNNDTISLTIDLIEGVCNSQFYESEGNLLKIYSILNIMLSILENTISNSDTICNSINGQLKGMKFYDGGQEFTEP